MTHTSVPHTGEQRRRLQPGEDVVTQGDVADFCFIIASGACDIVVTIPPSPETGVLEASCLPRTRCPSNGTSAHCFRSRGPFTLTLQAKERFITRLPAGARGVDSRRGVRCARGAHPFSSRFREREPN